MNGNQIWDVLEQQSTKTTLCHCTQATVTETIDTKQELGTVPLVSTIFLPEGIACDQISQASPRHISYSNTEWPAWERD